MPLLNRQQQISLKIEGTEGTATTLGAAGAKMLCYEPSYSADVELFERNPARAYLTPIVGIVGKQAATLSWKTELKGSGTAATRPAWDAAIRCCGFTSNSVSAMTTGTFSGGPFVPGETITGASSLATGRIVGELSASPVRFVVVTGTFTTADVITGGVSAATCAVSNAAIASQGFEYRPTSDAPPSATVGRYKDGTRNLIHGARGTVTIEGTAGEPVFLNFTFSGVFNDATDLALLSPTYETTNPQPLLDVGCTVTGLTVVFAALNVDIANTVAAREDANNAKGIKSFLITERNPRLTIDPEMVLVATEDFYGQLSAATTGRIYAEIGATAANIITVAAPKAQYITVGEGDRTGNAVANLEFALVSTSPSTGDDELQIAMI